MEADIFATDTRRLDYVGTRHDPLSHIPKVGVSHPVDLTLINARTARAHGEFPGLDEGRLMAKAEAVLRRDLS